MSLSPFGNSKLRRVNRGIPPKPQEATFDDFSGGLNLAEADLKLKTSSSKVENNVHRDIDGTKSVRWGTKFKFNLLGTVTGDVLELEYFRDKLVSFQDTGQIATITEAGVKTPIWSAAIAALLPGAPAGWSSGLTIIDTTEFKNEMVVCNGIDKPLLISKTHTVTYLQDVATGSNVNTPIGKFCTTVGNYTVIAGIPASPDDIYISSAGTSGTWPGDPLPNDSLSINIASYTPSQGGDIRGISSFKNFLLVHFATSTVVIVLGEYTGATHKPRVLDTIPEHGVISHRMIETYEQVILFADELGVHKAKRNAFGNAMESEKISQEIQADYIEDAAVSLADRLKSFSLKVHNENRSIYFLFKDGAYKIYSMFANETYKKRAWSTLSGWTWKCGCSTVKGRIFFGKGTKIYQMGNGVFAGEEYTADYMDDFDSTWLTATPYVVGNRVINAGVVYICLVNHTSDLFSTDLENELWEIYQGEPIIFDWEMPWTDANTRMRKKRLSFIGLDTIGTATFNVSIYTDNVRVDENGDDDPAISMEFVAGSSLGFGGGDQPFGGGRRAADERLWGFPCEFKIMKMRMHGAATKRLQWVAITILYVKGTYKR